jgi:hypothetical protein
MTALDEIELHDIGKNLSNEFPVTSEKIINAAKLLTDTRIENIRLQKAVDEAREAMLRTTYNDLYRPLYEWLTANPKEGNETIL